MAGSITRFKSLIFLYLWGILKSNVYANNPHSLEEVKQNIRHEIGDISQNELRQVAGHVSRCAACQIAQRHHFKHELWMRYVHHYAILTTKVRNESSACGSVVMHESVTVSAVRSLAVDGSPSIIWTLVRESFPEPS